MKLLPVLTPELSFKATRNPLRLIIHRAIYKFQYLQVPLFFLETRSVFQHILALYSL